MELKKPSPLGENKSSDSSITSQFLEIAKEKEKSKAQKVQLSNIDGLKLITPRKHGENKQTLIQDTAFNSRNVVQPLVIPQLSKEKVSLFIKTNKDKIINISLVVVPILILGILLISIILYTRAEPYRISREFLQLIEKKDFERAYDLSTDAYKTVNEKKDFEKSLTLLNSVDISNPKVKKKRIDNDSDMGHYAYITYKISGYYVSITMFNDSSDWGVHSIEMSTVE